MADAAYPDSLPCAQLGDFQLDIDYGVQSVTFEGGNKRQRKTFRQERMVFTLSIVLSSAQLWTWQSWANQYGYDWHWMNLESNYTGGTGKTVNLHYIRYTSDIAIESVDRDAFRVSLQAEMDLDTLPQGVVNYSGVWIVGGSPASPSANNYVGGSPASPSTDFIIAGSPENPAA